MLVISTSYVPGPWTNHRNGEFPCLLCVCTSSRKHLWWPKRWAPSAHCRPWADAKEIIPFGIPNPPVFWDNELLSWALHQWEPWICNPSCRKWGSCPVFCWVWPSLRSSFRAVHPSLPGLGFLHHLSQLGMHLQTLRSVGREVRAQHSCTAPLHQGQPLPDVWNEEDH